MHRPKYHDWTFPKGKLHQEESLLRGAVREVAEETGLSVVVSHSMPTVRYRSLDGPKEVTYWVMQPAGGAFVPNDEVDELRWVPLGRAATVLTYEHDRRLARELADLGPGVVRVMLVRHADAGQRRDFDGPDLERPLSDHGRDQARQLLPLLAGFGPTRVVSAPALRCLKTVEPAANSLRVPVELAPMFGEDEFGADPQATIESLRCALDSPDQVTVICSQAGVIPALIAELAPIGGAEQLSQTAAKASVWALSATSGRVRADYYPPTRR